MDRKTYKAFTLIEMLIVMGILIILMVIGVAAGRFAINRANDIAHQNGANQIYQALQAYFTDNGKFPSNSGVGQLNTLNIATMVKDVNMLGKYLDMGSFKGGSEADYTYYVNGNRQAVLVCVTLGGLQDVTRKGLSCVGNGFKDSSMLPATMQNLDVDKIEVDSAGGVTNKVATGATSTADLKLIYDAVLQDTNRSTWCGKTWSTGTFCTQ